jgi:hypothetical protein
MKAFKHFTIILLMAIIAIVTLTSCGGAPKGDDQEVKDTVKQIFKDSINREAFAKAWDNVITPLGFDFVYDFKYFTADINITAGNLPGSLGRGFPDYETSYQAALGRFSNDPHKAKIEASMIKYKQVCDALREEYNKLLVSEESFKLENIRTVEVDENIGKSTSEATVVMFDSKQDIRYTAQRNDKGQIYVEVFRN